MVKLSTCICLALIASVAISHQDTRLRKTGDQPAPGKCDFFILGGSSRVHVYVCCNNCNEKNPTCDGKTYQSASNGTYCDKCGVDNSKGNGVFVSQFSCGGCKRQGEIDQLCLKKVHKHHVDKPGFCWLYALCFRRYCKFEESETLTYSNHTIPETCFDLKCEPGETTKNCPVDCCRSANKRCNVDVNDANAMLPICCTEPTCCN